MAEPPNYPDISHLVNPSCFLPLPIQNPPHPFPLNPPSNITDPYELFKLRFYRHSAEACKQQLIKINTPVSDRITIKKVFRLWSIRQSSLLMGRLGGIARDEAKCLDDLGSQQYRAYPSGESLVPWNLRLLAIRIQAGGDNPQGIIEYYTLARESRNATQREKRYLVRLLSKKQNLEREISATSTREESEKHTENKDGNNEDDGNGEKLTHTMSTSETTQKTLDTLNESIQYTRYSLAKWKARTRNLGLFIGSMLMSMRDTKTAISLLKTLYDECADLPKSSNSQNEQHLKKKSPNESSTKTFDEVDDLQSFAISLSKQDSAVELQDFTNKVIFTLAVIYLQTGDTISGRQWFSKLSDKNSVALGLSICAIADADWDEAEKLLNNQLENLKLTPLSSSSSSSLPEKENENEEEKENEENKDDKRNFLKNSVTNNLAVVNVNKGKLTNAMSLLENLVLTGVIKSTVLMNLSILYDLQQDAGRKLKNQLLVALKDQGFQALENYDFLQ